jgi:hypothetical protein
LDKSLLGGERYLNFCAPGIKLGFEISDKKKTKMVQGEGGKSFEEK